MTIEGELDVEQVEEAFEQIIERHENLRTVFPSQEGEAQQVVLERVEFKVKRTDVSQCGSREERESRVREICQEEVARPFDLGQGPLLRSQVIKVGEQEHVLLVNMHHIISDGWSLGVLIQELGEMMKAKREGRSVNLPELPVQYADYSVWQRRWLEEGGILKRQLGYWEKKLAGMAESLDLATDYARPKVQSFAGATQEFGLDEQLTGELRKLAEESGGTLYMVLLAAFQALLYRYTGQEDICVGSAIANRQYGETEGLIGMFVNTLALRSRVEGEGRFSELLEQVKVTCLEGYQNQDAPFEKVVEAVRPERNMGKTPLFQVMMVLQNAKMGKLEENIRPYRLESGISKFDLTLDISESEAGLAGVIEYSTALYKAETMERLGRHFVGLCRRIVARPGARIHELEYLSEGERQQLVVGYNATGAEYPKDKCIHDFFVEQARCNPNRTAVVCGDEQLSYGELYEKSRELAVYLQSMGVKPDSIVGLCVERSLEMMVGLLGILQAGGAYVPLDPDYPEERLAYMIEDSRTAVVLTQEKFRERVSALLGSGEQDSCFGCAVDGDR